MLLFLLFHSFPVLSAEAMQDFSHQNRGDIFLVTNKVEGIDSILAVVILFVPISTVKIIMASTESLLQLQVQGLG